MNQSYRRKEPAPNQQGIGTQIKAIRIRNGKTQAEIADMLGYNDSTMVSRFESGTSDFPSSRIKELCKILETDANELFGITTDRNASEYLLHQIITLVMDFVRQNGIKK